MAIKPKQEAHRVELELESDSFSEEEQKKIVKMVTDDAKVGRDAMVTYTKQREKDLQHYYGEKPSILEDLQKRNWQSDRNLGLCPAVCDVYQAVLYATCWNPDSLHFVITEKTDANNKDNITKFSKWGLGSAEANVDSQIDDFIHNRVTQGFSMFNIRWEVWDEWIDRRIPKKNKKGDFTSFTIKTELKRFEKGVIENIDNINDILLPTYGKDIQKLSFFIHVLHLSSETVLALKRRKDFINVNEKFVDKVKGSVAEEIKKDLDEEKAKQMGIDQVSEHDMRDYPMDLLQWHGMYKKGKRREKYRFIVEPHTETLIYGKPLRKITRSGKIPYAGGAFIRVPGMIRGFSMPKWIAPIVNAFNNVFNQKSDFQYVTNCPFGFHNPEEGYTKQVYELEPMKSYPVSGDPNKSVMFPNLSRSMAWAVDDITILFELLEKLTGAASYFLTSRSKSATLGRDQIVEEKGETKFGLWVKRIMIDICEAINIWIGMYQDWAPPKLGERVLGKDGEQLIRNLSIETLRGGYGARMTPDITSGSKQMERQAQMWMFSALGQSFWMNPQINPKGSWKLHADTIRVMSNHDPERYMPTEPPEQTGKSQEVEDEWTRFMQGEVIDPPEGETGRAYEHLIGHTRQKMEDYHKLDKEYRQNFDDHIFKTTVNYYKFIQNLQQEQAVNRMAGGMVQGGQGGGQPRGGQPPGMPGGMG